LEKDLPKFEQNNAQVIAVAVQNQAGAQTSIKDSGTSYPILADANRDVANAYGVYNLLNDNVAAPSVFIINKSGEIAWSYIGKDINDRPTNNLILSNLPPL
jgi:peroxiredoxin